MARAPTSVTTETATYARSLMIKLGLDEPLVLGNAATGETSPLPSHIADLVRQVLASLAAGHEVTISQNLTELTPNEAAEFLNVSRTFVLKLMDDGTLPFRTVGTHRRIPYADLQVYRQEQKARSRAALDRIYELDRELGLHDMNEPPPPKSAYRGKADR